MTSKVSNNKLKFKLSHFSSIDLASLYWEQNKILRSEKIRILYSHPNFDKWLSYCLLAKNLYNTTLYHCYQQYNENGTIPNYAKLAKQFASENHKDFRALNNNAISQQVMQQVYQNFNSFFAVIKKNKGKKKTDPDFIKANPPKYYPKKDYGVSGFACPVQRVLKQRFKQDGLIQLSGLSEDIAFSSKIINSLEKFETLQQVRVVPNHKEKALCTFIEIELVYDLKKLLLIENKIQKALELSQQNSNFITKQEKRIKSSEKERVVNTYYADLEKLLASSERLCGIDLNLNQIALSFTQNQQDIESSKAMSSLFNIKPVKSINQYYNKKKAEYQSELDNLKNQRKELRKLKSKIEQENIVCGYEAFVELDKLALEEKQLTIQIKKQVNKIKKLKSFPLNAMIELKLYFISSLRELFNIVSSLK